MKNYYTDNPTIANEVTEYILNNREEVIKETIKKDLPPGFQRSEFLLEHGFLDFIVHRKELKSKISSLLLMFKG